MLILRCPFSRRWTLRSVAYDTLSAIAPQSPLVVHKSPLVSPKQRLTLRESPLALPELLLVLREQPLVQP